MILLNEYQVEAARTRAPSNNTGHALIVVTLGLSGEAGEFSEHIKKWYGHGHPMERELLAQELGDILWYVANAADLLGFSLSEIADLNAAKLRARYPDGFSTERSLNRSLDGKEVTQLGT